MDCALGAAGAIGGRFDHSIASVSFLYKIHKARSAKSNPPPMVSRKMAHRCLPLCGSLPLAIAASELVACYFAPSVHSFLLCVAIGCSLFAIVPLFPSMLRSCPAFVCIRVCCL